MEKLNIYFEKNGHAELVATFNSERVYVSCIKSLEEQAKKDGMILTEAVIGGERILYHAKCSQCGCGMNEGFCINGGEQYYCSDECLHETISPKEWEELYEDTGDSYWTEWDDEEFANYEEIDGELVELDN